MSWLPGALKDLLRHVPALLFEVVDWKAMRQELPKLTQRMLTGKGVPEVRQGLATLLPKGLRFGNVNKVALTEEKKRQLAETILELYFVSVLSGKAMFLDLRANHFAPLGDEWQWSTGNLWGEFSSTFTHGVRELYAGFFNQDDARFLQGLQLTGLVADSWNDAERGEMATLLKRSFKQSDAPMRFSLQEFQQSFQAVFDFLLQKKSTLRPDFLLLGTLLVTLYLALEELGHPHLVKTFYQRALARVSV